MGILETYASNSKNCYVKTLLLDLVKQNKGVLKNPYVQGIICNRLEDMLNPEVKVPIDSKDNKRTETINLEPKIVVSDSIITITKDNSIHREKLVISFSNDKIIIIWNGFIPSSLTKASLTASRHSNIVLIEEEKNDSVHVIENLNSENLCSLNNPDYIMIMNHHSKSSTTNINKSGFEVARNNAFHTKGIKMIKPIELREISDISHYNDINHMMACIPKGVPKLGNDCSFLRYKFESFLRKGLFVIRTQHTREQGDYIMKAEIRENPDPIITKGFSPATMDNINDISYDRDIHSFLDEVAKGSMLIEELNRRGNNIPSSAGAQHIKDAV
jgi:hypothetical protein